jgi:hypothetical protein
MPPARRCRAREAPESASSSRKSTKSQERSSPSASATTTRDYNATVSILRSVLHHKLGLPFACFFYSTDIYHRVMVEHFPELPVQLDGPRQRRRSFRTAFNDVLSRACNAWLQGAGEKRPEEKDFTAKLSEKMIKALQPHQMTVEHDKSLPNTSCRPDIVVRQSSTGHPVLVIEVGLSNAGWWQKMDQCLMYLPWLRDSENQLKHPVLLSVLTIESRMRKKKSVFSFARIGTFLATSTKTAPPVVPDFRLALLHRAEATSSRALSEELGKLMRAACLLPAWASAPSPTEGHRPRDEYLGPNCRRVGSKVTARSIDGVALASSSVRLYRSHNAPFLSWTASGVQSL